MYTFKKTTYPVIAIWFEQRPPPNYAAFLLGSHGQGPWHLHLPLITLVPAPRPEVVQRATVEADQFFITRITPVPFSLCLQIWFQKPTHAPLAATLGRHSLLAVAGAMVAITWADSADEDGSDDDDAPPPRSERAESVVSLSVATPTTLEELGGGDSPIPRTLAEFREKERAAARRFAGQVDEYMGKYWKQIVQHMKGVTKRGAVLTREQRQQLNHLRGGGGYDVGAQAQRAGAGFHGRGAGGGEFPAIQGHRGCAGEGAGATPVLCPPACPPPPPPFS
eukprot:COSAG01_NODE_3069_length_6640_cov_2.893441_1_plen_278_part_10